MFPIFDTDMFSRSLKEQAIIKLHKIENSENIIQKDIDSIMNQRFITLVIPDHQTLKEIATQEKCPRVVDFIETKLIGDNAVEDGSSIDF